MQGIEYILLHVQEPILYVVRKRHRHSPTQGKEPDVAICHHGRQQLLFKIFLLYCHHVNITEFHLVLFSVTPLADYYIIGGAVY